MERGARASLAQISAKWVPVRRQEYAPTLKGHVTGERVWGEDMREHP